ncbi:hypothetical protein SISSUDRAFT_1066609 [Sistotremastrum suecicum HHB10207 ss-3]|uniref:Uncharacterized protein n=1 Tax=Sistotremastrum suecicum HHB10207 ss-3 TaxID=1314776 RepID=A0A165Y3S5_9AGAM|nr:hypothetical protein SISSUDRAFT_1066609 [Sistotremastrum suecicum HHB10207 ss-3]
MSRSGVSNVRPSSQRESTHGVRSGARTRNGPQSLPHPSGGNHGQSSSGKRSRPSQPASPNKRIRRPNQSLETDVKVMEVDEIKKVKEEVGEMNLFKVEATPPVFIPSGSKDTPIIIEDDDEPVENDGHLSEDESDNLAGWKSRRSRNPCPECVSLGIQFLCVLPVRPKATSRCLPCKRGLRSCRRVSAEALEARTHFKPPLSGVIDVDALVDVGPLPSGTGPSSLAPSMPSVSSHAGLNNPHIHEPESLCTGFLRFFRQTLDFFEVQGFRTNEPLLRLSSEVEDACRRFEARCAADRTRTSKDN